MRYGKAPVIIRHVEEIVRQVPLGREDLIRARELEVRQLLARRHVQLRALREPGVNGTAVPRYAKLVCFFFTEKGVVKSSGSVV